MSRKKIYTIVAPTVTFVLGILVQVLLSQWITLINVIPVSLVVIMVILIAIFVILELIDDKLTKILDRIGLDMMYIEDGSEGKSYEEETKLVVGAKSRLICVGNWEPFPKYQVSNTNVIQNSDSKIVSARRRFYDAIKTKVDQHKNDEEPFHSRIVQISDEYMNKKIPFENDPIFLDYLIYVSKVIDSKSRSCSLKKTNSYIQMNFIIIDSEYIIIPILTSIKHIQQARYGILIIHDTRAGRLVNQLTSIYWQLENIATPIKLSELEP